MARYEDGGRRDGGRGSRPATRAGAAPSQRQLRVGELIRHALTDVLRKGDLRDPELFDASITVTEVRTSPDLKTAVAFVMPLGGKKADVILAALRRARGPLKGMVGRIINLKFVPELMFELDKSFDRAAAVDQMLKSEPVRRDLTDGEADRSEEGDGPAA